MKYRFGIVLAIVGSAIASWSIWIVEDSSGTATDHAASAEIEHAGDYGAAVAIGTSAIQADDLEGGDRTAETAIDHGPELAVGSLMFGRASPDQIENATYQRIAAQTGLELSTFTSVECDTLRCRVVFGGTEANPQYVDGYSDLLGALLRPPWNDYQPTQGNIGTRELAPGAREYVLEFTYVALVDASDDPEVAARQYAACAGAWARVTQLRGSDEYIQTAREQASKYLDLAARQLGPDEAQRLAAALQCGPLTRDCHAMPY